MHQIVCRLGLRPRPHWGSLQRSPDLLAGLGGGVPREWEGGTGGEKEGGGRSEGRESRNAQIHSWQAYLKMKSLEANRLWIECGRPRSGYILQEKCRIKAVYKRALRNKPEQLFTCKLGGRKPTHSGKSPPTPGILPKWVIRLFFLILSSIAGRGSLVD